MPRRGTDGLDGQGNLQGSNPGDGVGVVVPTLPQRVPSHRSIVTRHSGQWRSQQELNSAIDKALERPS